MPNKQQTEQTGENEPQKKKRESIDVLIGEQVIHALGKPTDLRDVQVRKLWDDHYRVNIVVGENAGCVRVVNSYFLATDSDGNLVQCTPKITKQY